MRLSTLALSLLIATNLAACKRDQPADQQPVQDAPAANADATSAAPAEPVTAPAAAPAAAAPAAKPFDLASVPVTTQALPPFPYVAAPAEVADSVNISKDLDFERVYVVAGQELRPVEGKLMLRNFSMDTLKWSSLAAHRNYETALKNIGAKRVDAVHPRDDKFIERNGGESNAVLAKMMVYNLNRLEEQDVPGYEQWLLRTPTTNIWISFWVYGSYVNLLTVEEKALQQIVQPVAAAETR